MSIHYNILSHPLYKVQRISISCKIFVLPIYKEQNISLHYNIAANPLFKAQIISIQYESDVIIQDLLRFIKLKDSDNHLSMSLKIFSLRLGIGTRETDGHFK